MIDISGIRDRLRLESVIDITGIRNGRMRMTQQGHSVAYHEIGHALVWSGAPNMESPSDLLIAFQDLLASGVSLPTSERITDLDERNKGQGEMVLLDERFAECYAIWKESPAAGPEGMARFFSERFDDPPPTLSQQVTTASEQNP